ncbi:MAG: NAD(P)H-hydrate dehydratase [Thermoanaerobaculum sp.]|nr:NAD(P)H-hydrate dehydratase [Thermoanaerobaculum sp.]MDW7967732.1 NAD(P)H-hydrate dehydratase [Thermoanaerobaculum sp.]
MIAVVDTRAMREADRQTIEQLGVPSLVLMEQAATAVLAAVEELVQPEDSVLVLCGRGNNGGDGLALARLRHAAAGSVEVLLLAHPGELVGDAAKQWELCRRFGVPCGVLQEEGVEGMEQRLQRARVVVDAVYGTGLDRPLSGLAAELVARVNEAKGTVVAVDIPSGLAGSSGKLLGPAVRADLTVTFGALKWAHVLAPAALFCGEVRVADIGIPRWLLHQVAGGFLLEAEDVARWLVPRVADAHKGHFGHLLVVAGRLGRAGAAALAARAGVVAGAGLVTVATPQGAVTPIQAQVPEAMVDPLPAGEDGSAAGHGIADSLGKATAVAVGPGLGLGEGPKRLLDSILQVWDGPLLLDADALTLLAGQLSRLRDRRAPTVLTPHPGELARLLGITTAEVQEDRPGWAQKAAELSGATVLLKGFHTLVATPGEPLWINPTGTPGLASGGAGDVLTGVVGALLAQGVEGRRAAALGAYLHGRAAELAGRRFGGAVPAGAVCRWLVNAEKELRRMGR